MNIYVCVKHVPDSAANITVKDDLQIQDNVSFLLNPYDEHAVTEAAACREHLPSAEVVAVCVGPETAEKTLRSALAMGADRGILILSGQPHDPMHTARVMKAAIEQDGDPALIFTGRESIDMEGMQTMFRLASAFDFPVLTQVISVSLEQGSAVVHTQGDPGETHSFRITLPCVLSVGREINTPAYPTFPDVVKSRKKPIQTCPAADLEPAPDGTAMEIVSLKPFSRERKSKEITGTPAEQVGQLIRILKDEARVL